MARVLQALARIVLSITGTDALTSKDPSLGHHAIDR